MPGRASVRSAAVTAAIPELNATAAAAPSSRDSADSNRSQPGLEVWRLALAGSVGACSPHNENAPNRGGNAQVFADFGPGLGSTAPIYYNARAGRSVFVRSEDANRPARCGRRAVRWERQPAAEGDS